jgi:hypothetical protein
MTQKTYTRLGNPLKSLLSFLTSNIEQINYIGPSHQTELTFLGKTDSPGCSIWQVYLQGFKRVSHLYPNLESLWHWMAFGSQENLLVFAGADMERTISPALQELKKDMLPLQESASFQALGQCFSPSEKGAHKSKGIPILDYESQLVRPLQGIGPEIVNLLPLQSPALPKRSLTWNRLFPTRLDFGAAFAVARNVASPSVFLQESIQIPNHWQHQVCTKTLLDQVDRIIDNNAFQKAPHIRLCVPSFTLTTLLAREMQQRFVEKLRIRSLDHSIHQALWCPLTSLLSLHEASDFVFVSLMDYPTIRTFAKAG